MADVAQDCQCNCWKDDCRMLDADRDHTGCLKPKCCASSLIREVPPMEQLHVQELVDQLELVHILVVEVGSDDLMLDIG